MARQPPELNSASEHPTEYGGENAAPSPSGDVPKDGGEKVPVEGRRLRTGLPEAGETLEQRFRIVRLLGRGGMGAVYEAYDTLTEERVALKVILPQHLRNERAVERFRREVVAMRRLKHPGVVRVLDFFTGGDLAFFTMELLEGRSLGALMKERKRLDLREAVDILRQLCDILEYAHQHIVHRDLSPSNVWLMPDGKVRLLDFGLVKDADARTMTATGAMLGKAYYMAPEQRKDAAHVDARADIYALGVMFYEMLTGAYPAGFQKVTDLRPELPEACDALLARCLVPREQRLSSATEFRAGLDACLPETPSVDAAGEFVVPPPPRIKRWPIAILAAAGLLGAVAILAGWALVLWLVLGASSETPVARQSASIATPAAPVKTWTVPSEPVPEGDGVPAFTTRQTHSQIDLGGGVKLDMLWIPPGTFTMGSPSSEKERLDNERQHQVTLTKDFWLGKYEVTQEQWERVMGSNPSRFKGAKNPVEQVSWDDAQAFCKKLGKGFRLPTEAEWEYACRAGSTTAYCFGDSESGLGDYAWYWWYGLNSGSQTHPVGRKKPNAWGLYDMHGNACELCQDWYGDYPTGSVTDPTGTASGTARVLRGGSWEDSPRYCRAAYRVSSTPDFRYGGIGFRLLRTP